MILLFQNTLGVTTEAVTLDQTHNVIKQVNETFLIYLIWIIIATLLVASALMAAIIFTRRTIFFKRVQKEQLIRVRYETLLAEYISGEHENEMLRVLSTEKETALSLGISELQNPLNRRIFKEQLLLLHKNLSGHETNQLRDLYLILGFKNESIAILKNTRNWQKRVASIHELSQMGIREAMPLIFPLINHRNQMVSVAALRTRVVLDIEPLALLDDLTTELTDWQKTHLAFMLSRLSVAEIPDFSRWFQHPNLSVAMFAKQMSAHFSDLDYIESKDLSSDTEGGQIKRIITK
jgi:hypothetical protein